MRTAGLIAVMALTLLAPLGCGMILGDPRIDLSSEQRYQQSLIDIEATLTHPQRVVFELGLGRAKIQGKSLNGWTGRQVIEWATFEGAVK